MCKTCFYVFLMLSNFYSFAQTLEKEVVVEDLRFVQETLEQVHPSLIEENVVADFRAYADGLLSNVAENVPSWQVAILAQQLLHYPKDAHTRSDVDTGNSRFLPVSFYWAADGLVVFPANNTDSSSASEVVQIGYLTPRDLEQKLSELISGNVYWVRAKSTDLLATETILRYLDVLGSDDTISLTYRKPSGEMLTKQLRLEPMTKETYRNFKPELPFWKPDETWTKGSVFAWKVEAGGDGLFSLRSCDYNDEFREGVKAFFDAAINAGVKNIVVDLRNNGGGDSRVVLSFLEHLPVTRVQSLGDLWRLSATTVERYKTLATTDENYAKMLPFIEEAQQRGERQGEIYASPAEAMTINRDADTPTFSGKLYILVNNHTFSAAIDFATFFSDNKLAIIVGEPVGDAPSSPGEILSFETPNLKLPFVVSTKIYVRPDPSRDPAETLEPDIYLPLTVKDIQQKRDPVKEWLEGLE